MRSYKKLVLSHEGFYNALYNDLKERVIITEQYKTLRNRGKGIDYELYKIIESNLPEDVVITSYRNMFLSKEGVAYWLTYFAHMIPPRPVFKEEIKHD